MEIQNKLNTAKIHMGFIVSFILFAATFIIMLIAGFFERNILTLLVPFGFLSFYLILHLIKPNFIYFNNETNDIVIKFFYVHPLISGKKKSFVIPKKMIDSAIISEKLFGFQKELTISVKTPRGVAKYPPISISILSKKDTDKIKKALKIS